MLHEVSPSQLRIATEERVGRGPWIEPADRADLASLFLVL